MKKERTTFKIREHEQLENLNYLLCYKSKSEIAEILIDTEYENKRLKLEIERKNKIIKEFRTWLEEEYQEYKETDDERGTVLTLYAIDKLNELEGGKNDN